MPSFKPHIGLAGRELRKTKMWLFLALVGHRGKREGQGMALVTTGHSACELSRGSVKNVEADVLSQWEVQSGG